MVKLSWSTAGLMLLAACAARAADPAGRNPRSAVANPPAGKFTEPEPDADGVLVIVGNTRDAAEVQTARQRIGPIKNLELPADRLKRIPQSIARLRAGKPLRMVMLGDSIVNDTARSGWHELVAAEYPGAKIERTAVVRGTTGCWWYKEPGRIQKYVLAYRPHLVIIGGISQQGDLKSIADCLTQIRRTLKCELFLMTGPYGTANPLTGPDWRKRVAVDERYAAGLRSVADAFDAEYFDMQAAWGQYVRASGKPLEYFKRDALHANAEGEAVLGRILEQYFAPPK